jgi:hypothetical protein
MGAGKNQATVFTLSWRAKPAISQRMGATMHGLDGGDAAGVGATHSCTRHMAV